jgi:hypothetical protein
MGSAAFDIYRLVNFLPSQHNLPISKSIIQVRGNISHRFSSVTPSHSRGRPMALAFFQQAIIMILLYGSGIHRPGSRSVIHGKATLSISTILQFIPLSPLSLPHLSITMFASGDSQIDEPSPSSSIHLAWNVSHSFWMASASSAKMMRRSRSGQYQRTSIQRRVSILDSYITIRASLVQILVITTA